MEVYKQAGEGRFRLTDKLEVSSAHQVGGSGVLKELGDSTSELAIGDLAVLMVLVSDNTATNILIDLVGMENVNRTMQSLGLEKTRLRRRMIDQAASLRGDENTSTPAEAARIMEMLYEGEFLGRDESDAILSILRKRKSGGVNSVLPGNIPVPFKPGGIAGVSTEWAIVKFQACYRLLGAGAGSYPRAASNRTSNRLHARSAWAWLYTAESGGHQPCSVSS